MVALNRSVTDAAVTPLHHTIYLVLRQQILSGQFPTDRPMPSEIELGQQFDVSRITIRRALERLQSEGLILRGRGRGTFAQPPQQQAQPAKRDVRGIFDNLMAMGFSTQVQLIECIAVIPPPEAVAALNLPPEAMAQRAVRVRSLKGRPFSHLTTHVPMDIASKIEPKDLETTPLLALIEAQGRRVASARQTLSARLADPIVAGHLQMETGAPVIAMQRTVYDTDERPVEFLQALYHPDIYEFSFDMARVGSDEIVRWQPMLATESGAPSV